MPGQDIYLDFWDHARFCKESLIVETEARDLVPMTLSPGQIRLRAAIVKQRKAEKPVRIIYLKSRRIQATTGTAAEFEIWVPVSRNAGTQHVQFGLPQGGGYAYAFSHASIEFLHEPRGGEIVNLPKADYDTAGAGVEKRPGQPDHALAAHELPETALARREHHQVGIELRSVHDDMEDDPAFTVDAAQLAALDVLAGRVAQAEVGMRIAAAEQNANRRLARDSERTQSYYRGMLAEIEKRASRRSSDAGAAEKDRSRIEATKLDRVTKLEDLVRKFSLRVKLELTDVLVVPLPVRTISVRLIRKKEERLVALAWNAVLRALDALLCEHCSRRAHPLFLCESVHMQCGACLSPCPSCGRVFCKVCQAKCKCGAAGLTYKKPPHAAIR